MKILIIGGGGREHAIGWKLKQRPQSPELYFAPGNAGTAQIGINIDAKNVQQLTKFAKYERIELTIVGAEAWLAAGIVDAFQGERLPIFGPDKRCARLESSKVFAKNFMKAYGVKTAAFETFADGDAAKAYLGGKRFPIAIKASGLAAGKGVIIAQNQSEAKQAIDEIMIEKRFGEAGAAVVIEEFLEGDETSVLSIFNGAEIIPFRSAKDHKKIGVGETGLNTGGMGVVAPSPHFTQAVESTFQRDILQPTLKGLSSEGLRFSGVIFFGLMLAKKAVYLLEYNLRMGDPETQTILPLLDSDLLQIIQNAVAGKSFAPRWRDQCACTVVLTSGGYPKSYPKGMEITGLDQVENTVFIAGAKREGKRLVTSGGRVLNVTALGKNADEAREKAYKDVAQIKFKGSYYRSDIGRSMGAQRSD